MRLRKEFWDKSKELIDWCEDEELKVLGQRVNKALEGRVNQFNRKFDAKEEAKKKARSKIAKQRAKSKQLKTRQ